MLVRFETGAFAVQGDLKQFYASIKLVPSQWNLQRILYRHNLDPKGEVIEALIRTLIWGIKCVSAQSECAICKVAESVKEDNPELYDLLVNCRFCDDLGSSDVSTDANKKKTNDADKCFSEVGLECKGWSFSGEEPNPELAEEGQVISIGGMK